jgi:3-oxoacyl-[acyl-carrier protein] reductase
MATSSRVVLITGCSTGIGRATAQHLAARGDTVIATARRVSDLDGLAAAGCRTLPLDVRDEASMTAAVAGVESAHGRIDVLVNNAGAAPGGLLLDLTEADWEKALQLKFMGYVRCMKAVIPHMLKQEGGRIVNIVGNDGVKPIGVELTPSAANAADLAVTLALAEQYGRENICINAINPGPVATERWDGLVAGIAKVRNIPVAEAQKRAERSIPLGRICTPEEVANVAVFVASPRASFMNGAIINLDGAQRKALLD